MNEKFNKDEVWNQLGKGIKGISEDNGDADDSQEDDRQHEDGDGLIKVDIKVRLVDWLLLSLVIYVEATFNLVSICLW